MMNMDQGWISTTKRTEKLQTHKTGQLTTEQKMRQNRYKKGK